MVPWGIKKKEKKRGLKAQNFLEYWRNSMYMQNIPG